MNYRGSYRKLLGNAKAALMGAIEIYNKPVFEYRDECVTILLLNSWELLLKATLSKNGQSVFYPKKRNQPYRTLSWKDAFARSETFFPRGYDANAVRRNLELLGTYRDNAVHFYNEKKFGVVVYALAQTAITNFRDLLDKVFGQVLEEEITIHLLPLGVYPPVDVVSYISGQAAGRQPSAAVQQFLSELAEAANEIKQANGDTGRLMTIFNVKLESVKKIGDADVVVGVGGGDEASGPLAVVRTQDPNVTHPLRQSDIVGQIPMVQGRPFTGYVFQAIAWKHQLKSNPQYCWQAREGVLTRYSRDVVPYISRLTDADVTAALTDYRQHLRSQAAARKRRATK